MEFFTVLTASLLIAFTIRWFDKRPSRERHRKFDKACEKAVGAVSPKHKKDRLTVGLLFAIGTAMALMDVAAKFIPEVHAFAEHVPGFGYGVSVAVFVDWMVDF